jgi:hypothetical protein
MPNIAHAPSDPMAKGRARPNIRAFNQVQAGEAPLVPEVPLILVFHSLLLNIPRKKYF